MTIVQGVERVADADSDQGAIRAVYRSPIELNVSAPFFKC
jgi:hypothetical protein